MRSLSSLRYIREDDIQKVEFDAPPLNTVLSLTGRPHGGPVILDNSPYGNNGTITGATWARNGQGRWYLDFDGTDDIVKFGNPASLDITGSQTIKAWVYPTGGTGGQLIYGKDDEVAGRQLVVGRTDTTLTVEFDIWKSGGLSLFNGTTALTNNSRWYHIVCVYTYVADGTSLMDIYVDGVLDVAQKTNAVGPIQTPATPQYAMGAKDSGAGIREWTGGIDLLEVESGAWTAAQVSNSHRQERHLFGW